MRMASSWDRYGKYLGLATVYMVWALVIGGGYECARSNLQQPFSIPEAVTGGIG